MNEQIEYLFDQALEEFKAENKYTTVVVPDPLQRDFVEKFDKLIIEECVDYAFANGDNVDYLKQYFGVEE